MSPRLLLLGAALACAGSSHSTAVARTKSSRVTIDCQTLCGDPQLLAAAAESAIVIVERVTHQRVGNIGVIHINSPVGQAEAERNTRFEGQTSRAFAQGGKLEANVPLRVPIVPDASGRVYVPGAIIRSVAHEAAHIASYVAGESRLPFWMREGFCDNVARRVAEQLHHAPRATDDPVFGQQVLLAREDVLKLTPQTFVNAWGKEPAAEDTRAYAMATALYAWFELQAPALLDTLWQIGLSRPILATEANTVAGRLLRTPPVYASFRAFLSQLPMEWAEGGSHIDFGADTVQMITTLGMSLAWRLRPEQSAYELRATAEGSRLAASIALRSGASDFYIGVSAAGRAAISRVGPLGLRAASAEANTVVAPANPLNFIVRVDTGVVHAAIGGVEISAEDPSFGPGTRWGLRVVGPATVRWHDVHVVRH
ncbi:MAG TPA: hypothetical protein VE967_01485 [Gemmatimonadaceae bacterium]|nr:hypothetical protein [Gemmatimonadaceae bacterium]